MKGCIFQFFCLFFIINESKAPFLDPLVKCVTDIVSICSPDDTIPDAKWQTGELLVDDYNAPLFTGTEPIEYNLKVVPFLKEKMFKGDVTIKIFASTATKTIELNSEKLCIEHVSVETWDLPRVIESQFKLDKKKNLLIITTNTPLKPKNYYNVRVIFEGYLYENNPFGFALYEEYTESAYMAETHFDPFFARKAFPCYDVPQYRTLFTLIVCRSSNERIISNMPNVVLTDYKTRPTCLAFQSKNPIPTNTVYFAVLDDGYEQKNRQIIYSVWTIKKYLDQASYAADDLENLAEAMKSLFALKEYDLSRIDLVLPINENKSTLLSYMRKNLLCDERHCSQHYQEEVTKNIVHQLSKFWFNSYVSIRSWDHLWLRDGLGVYYGYKLTSMIKPDWRMSDSHGSILMQSTLMDDGKIFYQPLTHSHELTKKEIFNMIYSEEKFNFYNNKASLIIRMLEFIVGESTFDKAMIWFLQDGHENGGLVPPFNLWNAFTRQIARDGIKLNIPNYMSLSNVMDSFVTQVGYPLLTVIELNGNYLPATLIIRQKPYVPSGRNSEKEKKYNIGAYQEWIVPIKVITQNEADIANTKPLQWSIAGEEVSIDTSIKETQWFILDTSAVYCRVNYSFSNWNLLATQLRNDPYKIPAVNRARLISDSHRLLIDYYDKTEISSIIPVRMLSYLHKEDDPIVWMVALDQFKRFYDILSSDSRPAYKDFFVHCLKYEYNRIGFEVSQNHSNKMWQKEMLEFLCWIGDDDCVKAAEREYLRNENDLSRIDPNLQHVVFCTMLRGRSSALVEDELKELLLENENNLCLEDTIRKVSVCSHVPLKSGSLKNKYESLLQTTITGNASGVTIVNDLLSYYWDTLLPLLEMMYDKICSFQEAAESQPKKDIPNAEIDGLIKFVELLKERHFGLSEKITFLRIAEKIIKLPGIFKYKKLGKAFNDVLMSKSFDDRIQSIAQREIFFQIALNSNKCGIQPVSSVEVELNDLPGIGFIVSLGLKIPDGDDSDGTDIIDNYIDDIRNEMSDNENDDSS